MKHTKILATYGPASSDPAVLKQLIEAGVNAFRVNCSHGTKEDFAKAAKNIRQASANAKFPIGLLFDISGPKLRLSRFDGELKIKAGDKIKLTSGETDLDNQTIGVNHPDIIQSIKQGERLLIDDGALDFEILSVSGTEVIARARLDGTLNPGKGINLPDSDIKIPTIGEKDREDILTAVECEADFIALSFVRSPEDILTAWEIIERAGGKQKIYAKLEKPEAIDQLDGIMSVADGVMVARGDLGVELPPEQVPIVQREIIRKAIHYRIPVIVATQMLESMRFSPRATRAEINDVASAVFDGTDAVMLSAETATGKFPVEAVKTMASTIRATEPHCKFSLAARDESDIDIPHTIALAVDAADNHCEAKAIMALTSTGFTAGLISNLFPPQLIIALCSNEMVRRQLTLGRSVYAIPIKPVESMDDLIRVVDRIGPETGLVKSGERVILTGSAPFGQRKPTNFMMIHELP